MRAVRHNLHCTIADPSHNCLVPRDLHHPFYMPDALQQRVLPEVPPAPSRRSSRLAAQPAIAEQLAQAALAEAENPGVFCLAQHAHREHVAHEKETGSTGKDRVHSTSLCGQQAAAPTAVLPS